MPLWSVATEVRFVVDPTQINGEVFHYSIPAVEKTGTGQIETASDLGSAKLVLRGKEVLISKLNPRKGRVLSCTPHYLSIVASPEFIALRPDDSLDERYLQYVLSSEETRQYLDANVQSVTRSHQRVTPELVRHIKIGLPPLDEQARIVEFLDGEIARLDSFVTVRQAQRQATLEYWRSSLSEEIDAHFLRYGSVPLRRVALSVEQGWSPLCEEVLAEPDEWAVLKTSAISSGEFAPLEHKRLPRDIDPDRRYRVHDGDLLMTRGSGSPDHVGVAVEAMTDGRLLLLSDLLYRVRMTPEWSVAFATLALQSQPVRARMSLLFRGQSGQTIKLRSEDVRAIELPRTPAKVQAGVSVELQTQKRSLGRTVESIDQSIGLLQERRQSLITAAISGQFDAATAGGVTA